MSNRADTFPPKTFEVQNALMDSTRWDRVIPREDDIVIATYAKSGTTWLQQIVGQLLSQGDANYTVVRNSPWIELRLVPPMAYDAFEKQPGRRFMKSHLLPGALPYSKTVRYIYVARDGRDVCWSMHNHFSNLTDAFLQEMHDLQEWTGPKLTRGDSDVHAFYRAWFEKSGYPTWPFWAHVKAWWNVRNVSNVKLLHFNDLKANLESAILDISEFLGLPVQPDKLPAILHQCSFDYMKSHASDIAPRGGANWKGGAETFINKGTNGRWRDVLSADEIDAYEKRAVEELGGECAAWLKDGSLATT